MTHPHFDAAKAIIDGSVVLATVTATGLVWGQLLQIGLGIVAIVCGIVLTIYRIRIAQRDWRKGETEDD